MAKLFKEKIIKQRLENFQIPKMDEKVEILESWLKASQIGNLKEKSEKEVEQSYWENILWKILGYTAYGDGETYLREAQPKAENSGQKADFWLGYFHTNSDKNNLVKVVIEVKDAKTSLDKPQQREGSLTPVQQGFKYKPFFKNCDFVIVSNFVETRILHDNYSDYEDFTLSELVNPKNNYYSFRKFYYLLCAGNLIAQRGESTTKKLLSDIRIDQESITKTFYKEYSALRRELYKDLLQNNSDVNKKVSKTKAKLLLEKAQKIIDRLIFIHFCEDKDLLPQWKLSENVLRAEELGFSPWDMLKKFFEFVNSGSEVLKIPEWYNGWLFKTDTVLDSLTVGNEICKKFIDLWRYDFEDDLSVNILGHIFEQSISDIEELKDKIQLEESLDVQTSKRKKDGIFYTPEYIVDYIVTNSVGKKIENWEQELKEKHKFREDLTGKNYEKRAILVYTELQQKLQNISVLDPACGSWAFLVKVFDFLLSKNKELSKKLEDLWVNQWLFSSESYFKTILQNNIYGVDLNEESVEITRLSLWLKTAIRGKKLANLDENIKCWNSLIDDKTVAWDKAFSWEAEFPQIFKSWGFDVIVGNPPYVDIKMLPKNDVQYFFEKYETTENRINLYSIFIEKSLNILKKDWDFSFVIPSSILMNESYSLIRSKILENNISQLIKLPDNVFENIKVETMIFSINKSAFTWNNAINIQQYLWDDNINFLSKPEAEINQENYLKWSNEFNLNLSPKDIPIISKIEDSSILLWAFCDFSLWITPYDTYKWHSIDDIANKVYHSNSKISEVYKPLISWENIHRYNVTCNYKEYIKYWNWLWAQREERFFSEEHLIIRQIISKNRIYTWYQEWWLYNAQIWFSVIPQMSSNINIKYLLTILNSKLISYYHWKSFLDLTKKLFQKILIVNARKLPIKNISLSEQTPFIEKADFMLEHNKLLQEKSRKFLKRVSGTFTLEKLSKKLQNFWELEFSDFVKELKKVKVDLSLKDQDEWEEYFDDYKTEITELKTKIDACDQEIDDMVFDLYGLSEEEREVVKGS